jgi:transcriptional regulator with XRE-family HTH domain
MIQESFGELLGRFRKRKGLSQSQLSSADHDLSASYISLLERSQRRGKTLNREQIWYLCMKLELWPPECDIFLEAAGHSKDRSFAEELDIQKNFKFEELWVYARRILDPDPEWFQVINKNVLENKVKYLYFSNADTRFRLLLNEFQEKASKDQIAELPNYLECIILPDEFFITDFAIYNPGRSNMYCCGTKPEYGKAEAFYTMHPSEALRLYQLLLFFRESLEAGTVISLKEIRRIYPENRLASSVFKSP